MGVWFGLWVGLGQDLWFEYGFWLNLSGSCWRPRCPFRSNGSRSALDEGACVLPLQFRTPLGTNCTLNANGNGKLEWQNLNILLGRQLNKNNKEMELQINDSIIKDPLSIATNLNSYFINSVKDITQHFVSPLCCDNVIDPHQSVFKGVMNWLFKLYYIVVCRQLMTFAWFLHSKTSKLISNSAQTKVVVHY